MSFLNPFLFISLIAVTIPIVIHLINLRRPQKLAYSTVFFFKELQKSTIRNLKLKRLLLLLLRVAAVTFLALALARPFITPKFTGFSAAGTPVLFGIVIDNGPSMGQIDGKGPYIEQARDVANILVNQARNTDRFLIYTTHGENRFNERLSPAQALMALDEIAVNNKGAHTRNRFRELITRMVDDAEYRTALYWITDARRTQVEALEGLETASQSLKERIPVLPVIIGEEPSPNVAITGVDIPAQIISYDKPVGVNVEVTNFGSVQAINQYVALESEGRQSGQYEISLGPGQSQSYYFESVAGKTGDFRGRAILEGDPVSFDNIRYFSVRVPERRKVLLVTEELTGSSSSYIKPVLDAAEQTGAHIISSNINLEAFASTEIDNYDAVILEGLAEIPEFMHGTLQRFVQDGKGLIVLPGTRTSVNSYNRFLNSFNAGRISGLRGDYGRFEEVARLDRLVEGHPVLDEIFDKKDDETISIELPSLYYYQKVEAAGGGGSQVLLRSTLNDPLLIESRYGGGRFLLFAMGADPGWSNFSINPLYAPLFYRSVLYAAGSEQAGMLKHTLGRSFDAIVPLGNIDVQIASEEQVFRPEAVRTPQGIRLQYAAVEWEPGLYSISDGETERLMAVNQDISESNFSTFSAVDFVNAIKEYVDVQNVIMSGRMTADELLSTIQAAGFGSEVWMWFIIAALICLIAETLITKMYKTEK
ncbi:MAG: BatA domain-containing protein [Rhodothermaceae bacterium]|nr:BatA domain-containing protein [Rhodothermaceae bacterium]